MVLFESLKICLSTDGYRFVRAAENLLLTADFSGAGEGVKPQRGLKSRFLSEDKARALPHPLAKKEIIPPQSP